MKIGCECGNVIVDQTDFLPYKGYIISDQDWFDLLDAIDFAVEKSGHSEKEKESALMKVRSLAVTLSKEIYQCTACGRVYIHNNSGGLEMFVRNIPFDGSKILISALGDNWRRPVFGSWDDKRQGSSKGYISCFGLDDNDVLFDNWDKLQEKYYSLVKELKGKSILRSALLRRNDEVVHCWDP